jgi:DNA invertase Pin-like site-specific DNA recombinase
MEARKPVAKPTVSATFPETSVIAVGYVRVSTTEQAVGGLGLDAQRAAIESECCRRHWSLQAIHDDAGVSAKTNYRPGLSRAVKTCAEHPGSVLVVAKLDRLARSLTGYAALMERAEAEGWRLVALDTPETDTPQGEAMQAMTAVFAQLERRLIGQRTKEALAAARSRGVRLGRPPAVTTEVRALILHLHSDDQWTATRIAKHLYEIGVDAPHGGRRWHTSTVTRILNQEDRRLLRGRPTAPTP